MLYNANMKMKKNLFALGASCLSVLAVSCTFAANEVAWPADYYALSYLESTGTQYIKTGVVPDGSVPVIEAVYQYVSSSPLNPQAGEYVFGYWYSASRTGTAIGREGSGEVVYRVYDKWTVYGNPDDAWHTVVLNASEGTKVDGDVAGDDGAKVADVADPNHLEYYIFARNLDNGVPYSYASVRLRSLKISQNGVLVRNFVPAWRKSDGVAGLLDRVTGEFFKNRGTGVFNHPYRAEMVRRLQYAESSGHQRIDTKIMPNGCKPVVRAKFQMLNTVNDTYIFGYWDSRVSQGVGIGFYNNKLLTRVYDKWVYGGPADTNVHEVIMNASNGTFVDGEQIGAELSNVCDLGQQSYRLFGRNGNGYCAARIYSFALDLDGTTVLDLVPARRKDGVVGMWDRRTGEFYAPEMGELVAGPEISKGMCLMLF